jgi:hypothetical protein
MSEQTVTPEPKTEKKPGFFGRIFQKLDNSMKQKAEEKSQQGSCCGGSDSKGGKCC